MENINLKLIKESDGTFKIGGFVTIPCHGTREEVSRSVTDFCEAFFEREGTRLSFTITDDYGCVIYASNPDPK